MRFVDRLRSFMMGRLGIDQFSIALFIAYFVLTLLSRIFLFLAPVLALLLYFCAFGCAGFSIFRMFSRNLPARARENDRFMHILNSIRHSFSRFRRHMRDRKTHVYVKCPNCGSELRVPRGKGKLIVTCPKCRNEIRITT